MGKIFETGAGVIFALLFALIYFPGGTIFMAMRCDAHRLDGWDWVLSVIIPAYGLMKGLIGSC